MMSSRTLDLGTGRSKKGEQKLSLIHQNFQTITCCENDPGREHLDLKRKALISLANSIMNHAAQIDTPYPAMKLIEFCNEDGSITEEHFNLIYLEAIKLDMIDLIFYHKSDQDLEFQLDTHQCLVYLSTRQGEVINPKNGETITDLNEVILYFKVNSLDDE